MLANLIVIWLILIAIKSYFDSYNDPSKHISPQDLDKFTIFECDVAQAKDNKTVIKNNKTCQQSIKKKSEYTEFQQDCYNALISLGMKKKEAKFVLHTVFNKYNPIDVEDFLKVAFIK